MSRNGSQSRHGLHVAKVALKVRGWSAIDKRTAAAQDVLRFQDELISDLGGQDSVSAAQRQLVELAARARLLLNHIDAWLVQQPSLLIGRGRNKRVLPVVKERQALAAHLTVLMQTLGLSRRAKPVPTLSEYLQEKEKQA